MHDIIITMGDPRGFGPDLIFASIKEYLPAVGSVIVIGDRILLEKSAKDRALDICEFKGKSMPAASVRIIPVASTGHPGRDALNYIDTALDLLREQEGSVLLTAPVEKKIISEIHSGFIGHTEYLAERMSTKNFAMSFIADSLKMSLLTTHMPLSDVSTSISREIIIEHVKLVNRSIKEYFNINIPRLVISSLNPHAGEGGLLGLEEQKVFEPAVRDLRRTGVDIEGPLPSNSALKKTISGEYDFLVSPYHDQILTSLKVFLYPSVNLTMGLPFIRTSPDHGPGIDLRDKSKLDIGSFLHALKLSAALAGKF